MRRWAKWGLRARAEIEVQVKVRSRVRIRHRSGGTAWPWNKVKVPHQARLGITAWILEVGGATLMSC